MTNHHFSSFLSFAFHKKLDPKASAFTLQFSQNRSEFDKRNNNSLPQINIQIVLARWHPHECCAPGSHAALISVTGFARLWQKKRAMLSTLPHLQCKFRKVIEAALSAQAEICMEEQKKNHEKGRKLAEETPISAVNSLVPKAIAQVTQGHRRGWKVERGRSEVEKNFETWQWPIISRGHCAQIAKHGTRTMHFRAKPHEAEEGTNHRHTN